MRKTTGRRQETRSAVGSGVGVKVGAGVRLREGSVNRPGGAPPELRLIPLLHPDSHALNLVSRNKALQHVQP